MKNYDEMKIEIEEFKKKLMNYFEKPSYDVTLLQLLNDLKLKVSDLNFLQYRLDELVEDGLLRRSALLDHYECDLEELN